jgi:hypothetical protein
MSLSTDHSFKSTLTPARIEYAYGLAMRRQQEAGRGASRSFAEIGWRAAKARDPKLLIALEAMAETTFSLQEHQIGRLMRDDDVAEGIKSGTTEHQLCREAYRCVDRGVAEDAQQFEWIYGAAAWLCGYNP